MRRRRGRMSRTGTAEQEGKVDDEVDEEEEEEEEDALRLWGCDAVYCDVTTRMGRRRTMHCRGTGSVAQCDRYPTTHSQLSQAGMLQKVPRAWTYRR